MTTKRASLNITYRVEGIEEFDSSFEKNRLKNETFDLFDAMSETNELRLYERMK